MQPKPASIAVITALTLTMQMHTQAPTSLNALRDHKRVLLIFAGAHDPKVEQQWSMLVGMRKQVAERDLVVVRLSQSLVRMHDGNSSPEAVFSPSEEQAVRAHFRVTGDEFTVILIGKDGGEKLRSHQPITWQRLQDTIDAMPMRQSEMRHSR